MIKRRDFEELQAKTAKLEEQLAGYQGKEKAIVEALTEAQNTASRRVQEAEDQARSIVYEAEKRREALIGENAALEQEGKARAAAIVQEAEGKARALREEAEADAAETRKKAEEAAERSGKATEAAMREYAARLAALNAALRAAAETARSQALSYAAALETHVVDEGEIVLDTAGLLQVPLPAVPELPEEYESPAELMQSIFRLQGREGPDGEPEFGLEVEATKEFLEEFAKDLAGKDPDQKFGIDIELTPDFADEVEIEAAPGIEFIRTSVVEDDPELAAEPAPAPASEPEAEPEERLWTVDEVIAAAPKGASVEAPPVDLNALLDDIMKENETKL